ncbi:MAG: hypothetical protein U0X20_01730 [Caldilineaceae bacterium]
MNLGNTLLGVPLVFWGIGCLAVAVAYYRIWPQQSPKRLQGRTQWQHIVLRYFHSLVWVLLAAGCFLAGAGYNIGLWVAGLALPVYIYFLVMVVQDRNRELADLAAQRRAQAPVAASGSNSAPAGTKASASVDAGNSTPGATTNTAPETVPAPSSAGKPEAKRPSGSVSK